MQQRRSTADERLTFVDHASFHNADAARRYGIQLATDGGQASRSFMIDEVTRATAQRMHYAAFRATNANRRREADQWRQRYYDLREQIILGNRKLIYRAVSRFQSGSMTDDLIGECHIVMIRAVAAYNPWLGIRFSTYACTCLFRALSRLGKRHLAERVFTSLDPDILADAPEHSDEPPSGWRQVLRHLKDDDALLTFREKRIIEQRFGLAGEGIPSTLDQVAAGLGISKERVRQLQTGALGKLRQVLLASSLSS